jgi:hypothetical protein
MTEKMKIIFAVLITALIYSTFMFFQQKMLDAQFIEYLQHSAAKTTSCTP